MRRALRKLSRSAWLKPLRLAWVRWRARHNGLPDWPAMVGQLALDGLNGDPTPGDPRILVASTVAGHLPSTTLESTLGLALKIRGAHVEILRCDSSLSACQACELSWFPNPDSLVRNGPGSLCATCDQPGAEMMAGLGLPANAIGDWLSDDDRQQAHRLSQEVDVASIVGYRLKDIEVGEHALAGALRFFARGDLQSEPSGQGVLRRFFEASILTMLATERLFEAKNYACVLLNHGIYVPQGIVASVARRDGVRVVTWHPAYRRGCFLFSNDDSYHHTMMTEPVEHWQDMAWSEASESRLMHYLKSRWTGAQDWIWFHEQPRFDNDAIRDELGLDPDKPVIGALTNVVWDAQLHYAANAFPSMLDWLFHTVESFRHRPDLQLMIRVHPAEIHGGLPSRQKAVDELRARFGVLPENVFVIPPESSISTYAACSMCDSVLIYGTKTGVELTSMGIPVVVAGEAWIRGKGLTQDASSVDHYDALLDALPMGKPLSPALVARARKYAFHFFFRRMIPLECMSPSGGWPPYKVGVHSLDELAPGESAGLDLVCDHLINGGDFVFPAEVLGSPAEQTP